MPENSTFKLELRRAIKSDNQDVIRRLFEPSDLDSNEYGGSLLHYTAQWSTVETARFLIENGAEIDRRGGVYDAPAITYAVEEGKLDIVNFLLEQGATLDVSHALRNPLMNAAKEGHFDVVKALLSAGIDPHASYRIPSGSLINAYTEAQRSRNKDVIELLESYGCHHPIEGQDIPIWEPEEFRNNQPTSISKSQQIIEYMEQRFGPCDPDGMNEILPVMEGLSVTINVIRPNELHPYLVLFTNGMSDQPMNVPAGHESWKFAELVMHLPPDWVHPREANSEGRWLWPVKWLRQMAYYPHSNDTWLGLPATIATSAEPPEPLGDGTDQSCLLMVPDFANLNPPLVISEETVIHFFTMVPLYTAERDFELKHGMKAFLQKFSESKVPMTVQPERPSFA